MIRATPLYFGPDDRPLFGWLHRSATPSPLGVVVCAPFGYEALCAHRSVRHFAEAFAAAGIPSLRVDYDGTGDSAGDDWDPDRVGAWVASVRAAITTLRSTAGVRDVVVLGVRLGALLGALAAAKEDVAGLVAIAPVVSGRAYLRELKALQQALGLTPNPAVREAAQESIGFPITEETRTALGAIALDKLAERPAPAVLVLDRDDFAPNDKWVAHLRAQGAEVTHDRLPGYVEMVLDPHKAEVPRAMIAAALAWTRALRKGDAVATDAPVRDAIELAVGDVRIRERAVFVDDHLFGIVSEPVDSSPTKAFLWLNAGAIHRVGPNRMTVELARQWAARGHRVLRLDVAGIGDSLPRSGEENTVYTDDARVDTASALAYLQRTGASEVHGFGLCSGAYNAFKSALAGQAFRSVVLINPATFFWKPGMSLDFKFTESRVRGESARYGRSAMNYRSWLKLARGKVKLKPLAQILSRRVATEAETVLRRAARRIGRPMADDLASDLLSVAKAKTRLVFVFAEGEPGLAVLRANGGRTVARLREKGALALRIIDGSDHTFTPLWAQERLASVLAEHLGD